MQENWPHCTQARVYARLYGRLISRLYCNEMLLLRLGLRSVHCLIKNSFCRALCPVQGIAFYDRRHSATLAPVGRHLTFCGGRGFHCNDDRLYQLIGADVSSRPGSRFDQRTNLFMDLGAVHWYGHLQHRLIPALSHPHYHRLVNARRGLADHKFRWRQLPRGHRCVHHMCRAGDYLWGDREF